MTIQLLYVYWPIIIRIILAYYYCVHCLVQVQKAEDAVGISEEMVMAQNQVKDKSFLGQTASSLCANTPVHWTYKACVNETSSECHMLHLLPPHRLHCDVQYMSKNCSIFFS